MSDNGWISVNERMPEEGKAVLIAVAYESCDKIKHHMTIARYYKRFDEWVNSSWDTIRSEDVACWMPYPKLPNGWRWDNE